MKRNAILAALLLGAAILVSGCSTETAKETEAKTEQASQAGTEAATDSATEAGSEAAATQTEGTSDTGSTEGDNGVFTRGDYNPLDYVTITNYKGLEFDASEFAVTDDEVQTEVTTFLNTYAESKEITDRAVQNGDTCNIDYKGMKDGVAFDGGTGNYDLKIGSGSFIDGFEEGLIGVKAGETVTLDLTFPDPYENNPDLAGAAVQFEVTVNSITATVLPELTDELVAEKTDYETVDAFKTYIKNYIEDEKKQNALAEALLENAVFTGTYPESLENYYYANYYDYYVSYYGEETIESYMSSYGMSERDFVDSMLGDYVKSSIQNDLILAAIAQMENIEAEGEEYDAFVKEYLDYYGYTNAEDLYSAFSEDEVKTNYCYNSAYDLAFDNMIIK